MIHYRIAAAIPTHNRLNDLKEAIASVLEQRVEIEIIVVDDGSDPPVDPDCLSRGVRLIRHARPTGPAGARNAAAEAATADWIAFLDDDDRWLPGKAEALLMLSSNPRTQPSSFTIWPIGRAAIMEPLAAWSTH